MNRATDRPLRFGLCGTGHWARLVHAPALAAGKVEFVGVYGRNADAARAMAREYDVEPFSSFEAMLATVDAMSFAVPPAVQAPFAIKAAMAGRHLLLEKPLAYTAEEADAIVRALEAASASAIVFLTRLFTEEVETFIAQATVMQPQAGSAAFRSDALLDGSPYAESAWRRSRFGALWDVGPHALSVLLPAFGPVSSVAALQPRDACFECEMKHEGGACSTMLLDLKDPTVNGFAERYVLRAGDKEMALGPVAPTRSAAFAKAVAALCEAVSRGGTTISDARFGRNITAILAAAEHSVEKGSEPVTPASFATSPPLG